jgi:hypothetical protein
VSPDNKGVLARTGDVDLYRFTAGTGPLHFDVRPWVSPSGSRGGNIDVVARLYDAASTLVTQALPGTLTSAALDAVVTGGVYYLQISTDAVGTPQSNPPTGYTTYGGVGQYFISGRVADPSGVTNPSTRLLIVTVPNPERGSVTPTNGAYAAGSTVTLTATASNFYRFSGWQGDVQGTSNPVNVIMTNLTLVTAVFDNVTTTNHAVPLAWLAQHGLTNNPEQAAGMPGSNGIPVWASYVAGLDPGDPTSHFSVVQVPANGSAYVLDWNAVSGRTYTVYCSTNLLSGFTPVPGAVDLPWPRNSFTAQLDQVECSFSLGVRIP